METKQETNPETTGREAVSFGRGGSIAAVGALSGVAIALGGPWVLLAYGQVLGTPILTGLIIGALAMGGLISLVSAFFGLVIPRHVGHGPWMNPERWRHFAEHRRQWRGRHGGQFGPPWTWDDKAWNGGDDDEAPAAKRKSRRPRD